MATHMLVIDGDNMYEEYGVHSIQGNVARALVLPRFKPVKKVAWQEGVGHQADLSAPVFESKDFTLRLAGRDVSGVAAILSEGIYKIVSITDTPITFERCRLRNIVSYGKLNGIETADFNLTSDDDPRDTLELYKEYMPLSSPAEPSFRVGISGPAWRYFDEMGVKILQGFRDSILSPSTPKQPLIRNVSIVPGMMFDSSQENADNRNANRIITIPMLLHFGESAADFWSRLYCLLYWLTVPGEIRILETYSGLQYLSCYYDSMTVENYMPGETPWVMFTVNMNVMNL